MNFTPPRPFDLDTLPLVDYRAEAAESPRFFYCGPARTRRDALDRLMTSHSFIAIDTETIGLKGNKDVLTDEGLQSLRARSMVGIGIATGPAEAYYFPFMHVPGAEGPSPDIGRVMRKLGMGQVNVFHNTSFDSEVIENALHIDVTAFPYADTMLGSQVQAYYLGLDWLSLLMLNKTHYNIEDILPKGKTMLDIDFLTTAKKCCNDVIDTYNNYVAMRMPEWDESGPIVYYDGVGNPHDVTVRMQECYHVDLQTVRLMRKMSRRGVLLDPDRLEFWYSKLSDERLDYESICLRNGFNPGSPQQVGLVLAYRGNFIPFTRPKKGQLQSYKRLSVDEEVLRACPDPLAAVVLEWRARAKILSTYVEPALGAPKVKSGRKKPPRDSWTPLERAYYNYRQDLATGRLGSFEWNFQNMPWYIRDILSAEAGEFTWLDLKQVEMRLFAWIGQDPIMLREISEDINIHSATQEIFWPGTTYKQEPFYNHAKTFNFAEIFDAAPEVLAEKAHIPTVRLASEYKQVWDAKYMVGVAKMESLAYEAADRGYAETIFGNRIRMPEPTAGDKHIHNCGRNYPIQAPAAQVIKRLGLKCDSESLDCLGQVHDELVFNGKLEIPPEWCEVVPGFPTPFDIQHGRKWK